MSPHSSTRRTPEYPSRPNPPNSAATTTTLPSRPSSTYPSTSYSTSTNLPPPQPYPILPNNSFDLVKPCPIDGKCALPYCFCSPNGLGIPGDLRTSETPQMVIITYEGAITDRIINIFKSLFNGKFKNPNGCAIKGTFFISHEWNNYDQVQWLFSTGHEIGVNSIT
uniref:Uncharacterized protein n=1 Tax=Panagrolaimus superbus TaxID=310955 RepID=A0A914YAE2_9BILA